MNDEIKSAPMDISFFTTEELVKELLSRASFAGVIIYGKQESQEGNWDSNRRDYRVVKRNLSSDQALKLISGAAHVYSGQA